MLPPTWCHVHEIGIAVESNLKYIYLTTWSIRISLTMTGFVIRDHWYWMRRKCHMYSKYWTKPKSNIQQYLRKSCIRDKTCPTWYDLQRNKCATPYCNSSSTLIVRRRYIHVYPIKYFPGRMPEDIVYRWCEVIIGSDNGLVPSGNKPFLSPCWPRLKHKSGIPYTIITLFCDGPLPQASCCQYINKYWLCMASLYSCKEDSSLQFGAQQRSLKSGI